MAILDVQALLQPLEPDPCGEDLEYDADFIALEEASRGKAEQQYGDTIIPAEPPDWNQVSRLGQGLLHRTKDLRVVCLLAHGILATDGVSAFCELLELIRGYVDNFWEGLHPKLDPDEGNSPEWRVNTVSALNNHKTIMELQAATVVAGGPLGSYSFHDFEVARGNAPAPEEGSPPTMAGIEAALKHEGAEAIREKEQRLRQGIEHLNAIESTITNLVGAANAAGFDNLREALGEIHSELESQLKRIEDSAGAGDDGASDGGDRVEQVDNGSAGGGQQQRAPGEIRSRDDVISTLDRLCQYYDRHEPSSPLPLLLRRAQRLATMSFLDIVKELTPGGLNEAKSVGGVEKATEAEE